jgi:ubiquinone/menaquinone biosynthesis C-methylase UbiE
MAVGLLYDVATRRFERRHGAALRARVLAPARGRVIEIGAGTGANLPHYPPPVREILAAEPAPGMRRRLRRRTAADPRAHAVVARAEALPFADRTFDTAVTTLALCTVDDPDAALRELRRVLVPGGRLLFLEHVRADDPRLARRQDRLARPWGVVAGGCRPNRDTLASIIAAGFVVQRVERGRLPGVPSLIRPLVTGVAVAPGD